MKNLNVFWISSLILFQLFMFGYERAIASTREPASIMTQKQMVMIDLDPAEDPKLNLRRLSSEEIENDPVLSAKFRLFERKHAVIETDIPED